MTSPIPPPLAAFRAALLLCALASPLALAQKEPSRVKGWLKARAQEYESFLLAHPDGTDTFRGTGQLWRERPNSARLPDFTPPLSLAPLIRSVRPGVVNISAWSTRQGEAGRAVGSGFIISPEGFVVTNDHVIDHAERILVRLADGREFPAETVGCDASTDVGLLKLLGVRGELPYAYLGDSDALEVGDWVLAIGNPFGLDYSVSQGILSAKERVIGIGAFDDFLQVDAPINPGNSGGPLFNMKGEVIGVTTAIMSEGQGIGFAVPISLVKDLLPNLRIHGHLERGWLGVNINEGRDADGHLGAVVLDVFPNSPAALAGLRPGDRLVAANGRPVGTYLQLLRRVALVPPGHEAQLTLVRDGVTREVTVKLRTRPLTEPTQTLPERPVGPWGLLLRESASPQLPGLRILFVPQSGPAAVAELQVGDLITEVNGRPVRDVRSFQSMVELAGSTQPALLRVLRREVSRYIAVTP